jgi:hypothetical protein
MNCSTLTAAVTSIISGTNSALKNSGVWETNKAGDENILGATDEGLDDWEMGILGAVSELKCGH